MCKDETRRQDETARLGPPWPVRAVGGGGDEVETDGRRAETGRCQRPCSGDGQEYRVVGGTCVVGDRLPRCLRRAACSGTRHSYADRWRKPSPSRTEWQTEEAREAMKAARPVEVDVPPTSTSCCVAVSVRPGRGVRARAAGGRGGAVRGNGNRALLVPWGWALPVPRTAGRLPATPSSEFLLGTRNSCQGTGAA